MIHAPCDRLTLPKLLHVLSLSVAKDHAQSQRGTLAVSNVLTHRSCPPTYSIWNSLVRLIPPAHACYTHTRAWSLCYIRNSGPVCQYTSTSVRKQDPIVKACRPPPSLDDHPRYRANRNTLQPRQYQRHRPLTSSALVYYGIVLRGPLQQNSEKYPQFADVCRV